MVQNYNNASVHNYARTNVINLLNSQAPLITVIRHWSNAHASNRTLFSFQSIEYTLMYKT